ncbi:hypothetical protein GCM10027418_15660 [Mariniluteicoccus endophyticus]
MLNHWFLRILLKEAGWKDPPWVGLEIAITHVLTLVSPSSHKGDAIWLSAVVLVGTAMFAVGAGWLALTRRDVR